MGLKDRTQPIKLWWWWKFAADYVRTERQRCCVWKLWLVPWWNCYSCAEKKCKRMPWGRIFVWHTDRSTGQMRCGVPPRFGLQKKRQMQMYINWRWEQLSWFERPRDPDTGQIKAGAGITQAKTCFLDLMDYRWSKDPGNKPECYFCATWILFFSILEHGSDKRTLNTERRTHRWTADMKKTASCASV